MFSVETLSTKQSEEILVMGDDWGPVRYLTILEVLVFP
jgi:hypothetical protein